MSSCHKSGIPQAPRGLLSRPLIIIFYIHTLVGDLYGILLEVSGNNVLIMLSCCHFIQFKTNIFKITENEQFLLIRGRYTGEIL